MVPKQAMNLVNKFLSKGSSIKDKVDSILGLASSVLGRFDKGKGKNDLEFFKKNQKGKADGENPDRAINELNDLKDRKAKAKVDNILPPNKEKFEFILDNSVDQEPIKKVQDEITKVLEKYEKKIGDIKSVLGDTLENIENVKNSMLMKLGFNTIGNNESLSGLSFGDIGLKLGSIGGDLGKALNKFNEFKNKVDGIKSKVDSVIDKTKEVLDFVKDPKGIINGVKDEILGPIKDKVKDVGNELIEKSIDKIDKNIAGVLGKAVDNFIDKDFNPNALKDTVNQGLKGFVSELDTVKDRYINNFKEEIVDTLANVNLYNAQEEINLDKFSKKANVFLNSSLKEVKSSLEKVKETSEDIYHKVKSRKIITDIDEIKLKTDKNLKYIFDDKINNIKNYIKDFSEEIGKDLNIKKNSNLTSTLKNQVNKLEKNIEKINFYYF